MADQRNCAVAVLLCLTVFGHFIESGWCGTTDGQAYLRMETRSDLDLHGYFPWGTHVCYWAPNGTPAGQTRGEYLSHDANVPAPGHVGAEENIYFPATHPGEYTFRVHNYRDRQDGNNPYVLRVTFGTILHNRGGNLGGTGDSRSYTFLRESVPGHNTRGSVNDWQSLDTPARYEKMLPTWRDDKMATTKVERWDPSPPRSPSLVGNALQAYRRGQTNLPVNNAAAQPQAFNAAFNDVRNSLSYLSYLSRKGQESASRHWGEMHVGAAADGFGYGLTGGANIVTNEYTFGLSDRLGLSYSDYYLQQGGAFNTSRVLAKASKYTLATAATVGVGQAAMGANITARAANLANVARSAAAGTAARYISRLPAPAQQKVLEMAEGARSVVGKSGDVIGGSIGNIPDYSDRAAFWLTHRQSGAVVSGVGEGLVGLPPGSPGVPTNHPGIKAASEIVTGITVRELEEHK